MIIRLALTFLLFSAISGIGASFAPGGEHHPLGTIGWWTGLTITLVSALYLIWSDGVIALLQKAGIRSSDETSRG